MMSPLWWGFESHLRRHHATMLILERGGGCPGDAVTFPLPAIKFLCEVLSYFCSGESMTDPWVLPLSEHKCNGKIMLCQTSYDMSFKIKQMQNGCLLGELDVHECDGGTVYDHFTNHRNFSLDGTNDLGDSVLASSMMTATTMGSMYYSPLKHKNKRRDKL